MASTSENLMGSSCTLARWNCLVHSDSSYEQQLSMSVGDSSAAVRQLSIEQPRQTSTTWRADLTGA